MKLLGSILFYIGGIFVKMYMLRNTHIPKDYVCFVESVRNQELVTSKAMYLLCLSFHWNGFPKKVMWHTTSIR